MANIKYCTKCGAENSSEAKFCCECGNKFIEETGEIVSNNTHKTINGFCVASFCLTIVAWLINYNTQLFDIVFFGGIIFAFVGLHYVKTNDQKGKGLAIASIISYALLFIVMVIN